MQQQSKKSKVLPFLKATVTLGSSLCERRKASDGGICERPIGKVLFPHLSKQTIHGGPGCARCVGKCLSKEREKHVTLN